VRAPTRFHHIQLIPETQVLAFSLLYMGLGALLMSVMRMDRSSLSALVRSFTISAAVSECELWDFQKVRCVLVKIKVENPWIEGEVGCVILDEMASDDRVNSQILVMSVSIYMALARSGVDQSNDLQSARLAGCR
jgi:hypothetical protein